MGKHTLGDLKQMQSLPLEAKELMSMDRIKSWFDAWNTYTLRNTVSGRVTVKAATDTPKLTKNQVIDRVDAGAAYVSFSGGKDSTVLSDLVARVCKEYGYKLILLFINTGLEYPDVQNHVRTFHKWLESKYDMEIELVVKRPEMRFDQVIKKYGYPLIGKEVAQTVYEAKLLHAKGNYNNYATSRLNGTYTSKGGYKDYNNMSKWRFLLDADFDISHKCCYVMKKTPATIFSKNRGLMPIIGTMASESSLRRSKWLKHGCNVFDSHKAQSNPISFWTDEDVLKYAVKYNIPLAKVYGDIIEDVDGKYTVTGQERTGCVFCAFGAHCRADQRFKILKELYPRHYDYCINGGEYDDSGKWIPNKTGLGLKHILDYIGASDKY